MDICKDILPSILQTKEDVLDDEKEYIPFLVNRALSYHDDCLFYANQMNMLSGLDRRLQYQFCLNTIRSRKRSYQKWAKPIKEGSLQAVKMYFGYSDRKAVESLKVLTNEQITLIEKRTTIGE